MRSTHMVIVPTITHVCVAALAGTPEPFDSQDYDPATATQAITYGTGWNSVFIPDPDTELDSIVQTQTVTASCTSHAATSPVDAGTLSISSAPAVVSTSALVVIPPIPVPSAVSSQISSAIGIEVPSVPSSSHETSTLPTSAPVNLGPTTSTQVITRFTTWCPSSSALSAMNSSSVTSVLVPVVPPGYSQFPSGDPATTSFDFNTGMGGNRSGCSPTATRTVTITTNVTDGLWLKTSTITATIIEYASTSAGSSETSQNAASASGSTQGERNGAPVYKARTGVAGVVAIAVLLL